MHNTSITVHIYMWSFPFFRETEKKKKFLIATDSIVGPAPKILLAVCLRPQNTS